MRAAHVIVVSSVMFTFISYWRTAAVVLCDLASTAYYIGGIVEQSVGPAAPWFILAVMLFSYAVRSVYIESCSLFVRGGVYRVVKEALGGFLAKLSVSALMFDYILTGPISGVSAGQYIMGLAVDAFSYASGMPVSPETRDHWRAWGAVAIATLITLYFFWQNLIGIHESSDKALKIMLATTVMAVVILVWCGITLLVDGPRNSVPLLPDLAPKLSVVTHEPESPLGFLRGTAVADQLAALRGNAWLSMIGLVGLFIAFGHSILAMSGEETLAQVYREVEAPKLKNFKKAAFIVFVYSLCLTAGISFLAVLLIPDDVRMSVYADNLIGGLAMSVSGPIQARFLLNAFVVVIGSLILAGAVNTAIIGANGVLNRVAEDGVMPDWFLKPHKRFGTTYRILYLILALQILTILLSRGDVLLLGEAYAFGVVWSFVFKALAMVVLRFRDPSPREYKVPLNFRVGKYEVPVGLSLIFLVLAISAIMNLLTKEVATTWGLAFTGVFLVVFMLSEHFHEKRLKGQKHVHQEQFNRETRPEVSRAGLGLKKPYTKLVAIRSTNNLFMLEKSLSETDPLTTDVVVMTAKMNATADTAPVELDSYDQKLMTAVVERAEKAGKHVTPLIVPTNNPLFALVSSARQLGAQELIVGMSNINTADEQLDQLAFYWFSLDQGPTAPITIRILSRDRDVHLDLSGGSRIPRISERQARSVSELRAAGVGVDRVFLVHENTRWGSDMFEAVLTILDPGVALDVVSYVIDGPQTDGHHPATQDQTRARQLGREITLTMVDQDHGPQIVRLARTGNYGLIILSLPEERPHDGTRWPAWIDYVLQHAHCQVFMAARPIVPMEVEA
jgi:amino acid transporter